MRSLRLSAPIRALATIAIAICSLATCCAAAEALSLQPVGTFARPISIVSAPHDPDRLFVAEREGRIVEVVPGGTTQFASITSLVSCCESERGLLSILPAADFETTERLYVAYTGTATAGGDVGDIHVDSIRPDPGNSVQHGLLRDPILSIPHADEPSHNGGQLQLGPDGYLYLSTGDGGGEGDPLGSGQDTGSLLGKILRIDPRPGQVPAYAIPPGNPFAADAGADEIWSYGLRNPWRFSFDRESGDMVIGDVGQGLREEVDLAASSGGALVGGAGANYGWGCREGLIAYPPAPPECSGLSGYVDPVFDYVHQSPAPGAAYGCSIIGGYVVRDPGLGELVGRYVYADFCVGQLRSLLLPNGAGMASGDRAEGPVVEKPISFGEDSCGRLYLTTNPGTVYRLVGATPTECHPSSSATTGAPPAGQPASGTLRVLLRAREAGKRTKLIARVAPCADGSGTWMQLNRGGRRFAARRLDQSCTARFFVRVADTTTFRALLPANPLVRSRRLTVRAPGDAQGNG